MTIGKRESVRCKAPGFVGYLSKARSLENTVWGLTTWLNNAANSQRMLRRRDQTLTSAPPRDENSVQAKKTEGEQPRRTRTMATWVDGAKTADRAARTVCHCAAEWVRCQGLRGCWMLRSSNLKSGLPKSPKGGRARLWQGGVELRAFNFLTKFFC